MKKLQILLLTLIIVGIGLIATQKTWVPKLVSKELAREEKAEVDNSFLVLNNKRFNSFPKYVLSSKDAVSLDLSNNSIPSVPAEIKNMTHLSVLNLAHNTLTGIPAEIGDLHDLTVLDLSYNSLTGLPHELGKLSKLKILNLTGNQYSKQDLIEITRTLPTSTLIMGQ